MKTHKEYLDKQLSDKKFADGFYREKEELKMNKEYAEKASAMTDEELRIKAAEFMGDKRAYLCCEDSLCPPSLCLYGEEDVYDCIHLRDGGDVNDCPEMRRGDLPDYPIDIDAAWKLVMTNPDWRWAVYELDAGGWCASPMEVIGVRGEHCLWDHVSEATGETAQRAITKAFIMAMEAND